MADSKQTRSTLISRMSGLVLNRDVEIRFTEDGGAVLIDTRSGISTAMNSYGAEILRWVTSSGLGINRLIDTVAGGDVFDPNEILSDISDFIDDLESMGVMHRS